MKLCPQCAFIYEDNQRVCDMDGKELVQGPAPLLNEQSSEPPTERMKAEAAKSQSRWFPVLAFAGLLLAVILSAIFLAQPREVRSTDGSLPIQSPENSTTSNPNPEISPAVGDSSPAVVETPLPAQSPEQSPDEPLSSPTNAGILSSPPSPAPAGRARMAASPITAGTQAGKSRGPFMVRLTNGATIKAEDTWERREGIWYRQGGLVTLLKRSRVRTIERLPPNPQSNVAARVEVSQPPPKNVIAQNQLSIRRLENPEAPKQSRVKSFLKKTGRILKKPFRL